jgi:hypothetical protein
MTFDEFLKNTKADADTLQQALRMYLSEATGDLTPEEMRANLSKAVGDRRLLEEALAALATDSSLAETAARAYFEFAWADETRQPAIRAAVDHAKSKLPVVEAALIAMTAMYAMHLIATGGVVEESQKTETKSDGSSTRSKVLKRESFAPIAAIIGKLFGKK